MYKKFFLAFFIFGFFSVDPSFAAWTTDQWKIDLELFQKAMNSTPKDYLGAVNLARKWENCPDETLIKDIGITKEGVRAGINNIYREVAQVLHTNYVSLIGNDPLKAAELVLNVQQFFKSNSDILKEFATAIGTTPERAMKQLDISARNAFMETYRLAAKQYSTLNHTPGKEAEAKKLSDGWAATISYWNAHNSPLPEEFRKFTGVDPLTTVDNIKELEKDIDAWYAATAKGDFNTALGLVGKWEAFSQSNPGRMAALNFIFNKVVGAEMNDKVDWGAVYAETYARLAQADLESYTQAFTEGRINDAMELLNKWENIIDGQYGSEIAIRMGSDLATVKNNLAAEKKRVENIDPKTAGENLATFKKDLDEFNQLVKIISGSVAGNNEWWVKSARAAELCDKWVKIARENPALAAEIKKATGIDLPKGAQDTISYILDMTVTISSSQFNSYMGSGKFSDALNVVKGWKKYLEEHPQVKEVATEKWGQKFMDTLNKYETGLATIASVNEPNLNIEPDSSVVASPSNDTSQASSEQPSDNSTPGTLGPSGN